MALVLVVLRLLFLQDVLAPHRLLTLSCDFIGILDVGVWLPSLSLSILEPLDVGEDGALPVE